MKAQDRKALKAFANRQAAGRAHAGPCGDAVVDHDQGPSFQRYPRPISKIGLAPPLDLGQLALRLPVDIVSVEPG